ncbi:MAG: dipeptidase [Pseudomonadota bacterium]
MQKNNTVLVATAVISLLAGCSTLPLPLPEPETMEERALRLAQNLLLVDTHIDVPYRLQNRFEDVSVATENGDFDFPRARAGGLDAPFMSIYIPAERELDGTAGELANELIDMVENIASESPDKFAIATSTGEVEQAFANGLIALPMGMENGAPIAGDLGNLQHFYDRGIRYITLTHSKSNHICDSSYDEARPWNGLSPFGEQLVEAMNRTGVMIDISHVSDEAFYDVMALSKVPVIASHSSARRFTPGFERNMSDDMIRALASRGGIIQINFGSTFISADSRESSQALREARDAFLADSGAAADSEAAGAFTELYRRNNPFRYASLSEVLDHFDHVRDLVGVDHVGIGSDYDGVGDSLPVGLKDVATYPNLIAGLLERGYSEDDIRKILGGNLMRVWRETERYAAGN